jgi:HEAT repeat protein
MMIAEPIQAETRRLIKELESNDPVEREVARHALVRLGTEEVTAALVAELLDPRQHVRWEAAKALGRLRNPVSAPALLDALDDNDGDVRWVAAEGLISLGRVGLLAALHGLTKHARSLAFRTSAHHVLHELLRQGESPAVIAPVLAAVEQADSAIAAPPAAFQALMALKVGVHQGAGPGAEGIRAPAMSPSAP